MPEPKIKEECCFGCMNCVLACPRGILVEPETGMVPVIKASRECTGCKRCIDACPHNAITGLDDSVASCH